MENKKRVPLMNKVAYGIGTGGGCIFNQIKNVRDDSKKPYAMAAKAAHSKIIALTFYFE